MEELYEDFNRLIEATRLDFERYLYSEIDWKDRLISIVGPRGTGKTTLILQHIKKQFPQRKKALYISLDNIRFTKTELKPTVHEFYTLGGTHIFIDEVHRYPNWAIEIKNLYDSYPDLHIVFTGSSILEIYKSNADLSRRAITYHLHGLSFREFLKLEKNYDAPILSLQDVIENHMEIASRICSEIKITPAFRAYLEYGYYPFFKEGVKRYSMRLRNVVNVILETDLPAVEKIEYASIYKLRKMLMIVSSLVPYTPNISTLSGQLEINRASVMKYFIYLQKAGLVRMLLADQKGMNLMNKPEKLFLDNTNLIHALAPENYNTGNIRETFFANQLTLKHTISGAKKGDFIVDDRFTFEIGGINKTFKQIKELPESYIAKDDIETGYGNTIPLWLFGLLY
ncbi:MAG: AAA family ATPase [Paludibacter sp.]